jgi:hypothetical protein
MSIRAVSRVQGLVSMVLAAAFIGGCSSSPPGRPDGGGAAGGSTEGNEGTAGAGGKGGNSGAAGSGGTGGATGSAGSGGGAGSGAGGSSVGGNLGAAGVGTAGTKGSAGTAGMAGAAGGAGGPATAGAGGTGAGGSAGGAGGVGGGNPDAPVAISTGNSGYACALTAGGSAACWVIGSKAPVAQAGLIGTLTALSSGGASTDDYEPEIDQFSCGITTAGALECWGENVEGELGNGSTGHSGVISVPGFVPGLTSGVTALSAGGGATSSACAVVNGGVQCWGQNGGLLGGGSAAAYLDSPVSVTGFTGAVTAVSVGAGFGCAIVSGGAVQCWGTNTYGQLGNGVKTNSPVAVQVSGLTSGVIAISAAASSACALTSGGGVDCWGYGADGELGNGSTANSAVPVSVYGLTSGVTAISTAGNSACAIVGTGGALQCWGGNNDGQLGNGSTSGSSVPVAVATLSSGVNAVSVGVGNVCVILSDGTVSCWGGNAYQGVVSNVPAHIAGIP